LTVTEEHFAACCACCGMSQSNENIAPSVVMAVAKELRKLTNEPLEGIKVLLNEEDITNIVADIAGPVATPFHSGTFKVKLVLPSDYPASPPKGYFLTKIYHPNISKAGEICVNTLKRDWKQARDPAEMWPQPRSSRECGRRASAHTLKRVLDAGRPHLRATLTHTHARTHARARTHLESAPPRRFYALPRERGPTGAVAASFPPDSRHRLQPSPPSPRPIAGRWRRARATGGSLPAHQPLPRVCTQ